MTVGKLIGRGATAEIFEMDGSRVLKLFRSGMPEPVAIREYDSAAAVYECGVPSPKPLDCIEQDERIGIVYERAQGRSMMKHMLLPWQTKKDAELLAVLQYGIHQKKPQGLPPFKKMLERNIRQAEPLTDTEKQTVLGILEKLPDGDRLCHADFHPDNILLGKGKPVILDWMTACTGAPAADVARTSVIFATTVALPDSIPPLIKKHILHNMKSIHAIYLNKYRELSGMTQEQIDAWKLPLMAARLVEWRPPYEKDLLLREIRSGIGSSAE